MMTYKDAVAWLKKYPSVSCVSANALDGAGGAGPRGRYGLFLENRSRREHPGMVVGPPAPALDVVVPFMVGWYLGAFGQPTPAQLAKVALFKPS